MNSNITNDIKSQQKEYISNIEEHQYLTFIVSDEVFGMGVLNVKEIITYGNITKVPSMSSYIDGVTNVRGNIIPVVSLALRFGLEEKEITNKTCIIIVTIENEGEINELGVVVDKVNQVHDILPTNTEDTPSFGTKVKKEFLEFIGKIDGKFISILNNKNILNIDELGIIQERQNFRRKTDARR
jgi:purine-binding chemotaxis protein CheW